jgi:beta-1,4-mannosyltransferase
MNKNQVIGFYPGTKWHAYQQQMACALKKQGYEVVEGDDFNDQSLLKTSQNILHFHWIERLWDASTWFGRLKCLLGCALYLRKAKKLHKTIVWTVHNNLPHQDSNIFDWLGILVFTNYADVIACHSEWSKAWLQKFSLKKISPIIVWHGNFAGIYEPVINNSSLKDQYSFCQDTLLLGMVGEIRPNRGHEEAILAAQKLGTKVQLLIAGRCKNEAYLHQLKDLAQKSDNVIFVAENLTDQKYNDLIAVSDITLLPYKSITTSGALLSSWTIGVPTITSDLAYFEELKPENWLAGSTYELGSVDSLVSVITKYLGDYSHRFREAAREESALYSWDKVIVPLVVALDKKSVELKSKD